MAVAMAAAYGNGHGGGHGHSHGNGKLAKIDPGIENRSPEPSQLALDLDKIDSGVDGIANS